MSKYIELKIGKMRKPQNFLIQTVTVVGSKERTIVLQSNKSIGMLNPDTGEFKFTTDGSYFPNLAFARITPLDVEVRDKIIEMAGDFK